MRFKQNSGIVLVGEGVNGTGHARRIAVEQLHISTIEQTALVEAHIDRVAHELNILLIEISTIMQNADFFDKWVGSYPFYSNIKNEGVELYAVCASGKCHPPIPTGKA